MIKMISIWHSRAGNHGKRIIPAAVIRILGSAIVLLFNALPALTQNWHLDASLPLEVSVTGTSTLHDWKATCSGTTGVPEILNITGKNTIDEFEFKIPVDSMDGGRGATMNNKIRTAFKSAENPFISYRQTEPAVLSKTPEDGSFDFTSKGVLSLAGKDKPVTVLGKGTIKNGLITITVDKELKMTDFEIEPPSAMFGQIKTHDDVVVHFVFHYKQAGNE